MYYISQIERPLFKSIYVIKFRNYGIYFAFELYFDQYGAKKIYQDINNFVHEFVDELCLIEINDKVDIL